MDKKELREQIGEKIENLSAEKRAEISQDLRQQLVHSDEWKNASLIGITMSAGVEWNTRPIIEQAWSEGKAVAVPKSIHDTREMMFYKIENFDQVESGYFDILEPDTDSATAVEKSDIDLLVVPGRVFSLDGYRIGFGGGFYDRFLEGFENQTVSLLWQGQVVDEVPTNQYDIPVEKLIISKL